MGVFGDEAGTCSQWRILDRICCCDVGMSAQLGRQFGRQTQWTWDRAQVSHGTSTHDDGHHDDLLAHERRYHRVGRLSDRSQEFWTAEIYYLSWTSVKHHHVSQHWWNDTQRVLRQQNRV